MASDYITLLGAEQVSNASRQMASAATDMIRAASQIDETFRMFTNRMEDWVTRLETLNDKNPNPNLVTNKKPDSF